MRQQARGRRLQPVRRSYVPVAEAAAKQQHNARSSKRSVNWPLYELMLLYNNVAKLRQNLDRNDHGLRRALGVVPPPLSIVLGILCDAAVCLPVLFSARTNIERGRRAQLLPRYT